MPATPPPTVPAEPLPSARDEPTSDLAESPTLGADAAFEGGASIGPYRLVRKLGQGGMGTVWEAVHKHLHKAVAVKALSPKLMRRPEVVARFYQEMKAAGRVTHPNVVQAYDAGEFGGVHFLAMELVDGIDLHRHIAKSGPLSPPYAARALRQAALGLAAAHAEGLVHRDVKPMNLLVNRRGRVKILDLGLARVAEEAADEILREGLTAEGHVLGTPDYMAPEQWDDPRTVGPAADLYSLGCTLFFLLAGKPPFGSDRHSSAARKMVAHLGEEPPDLASIRPDVPPELNAIYRRLVAKRPEERPASASELANLLAPLTVTSPKPGGISSQSLSDPVPESSSRSTEVAGERVQSGSGAAFEGGHERPYPFAVRTRSNGRAWAGCFGAIIGCICMAFFCLCSIFCIGLAAKKPPKDMPASRTDAPAKAMPAEEKAVPAEE
jgi:serine/threonine protein kinase